MPKWADRAKQLNKEWRIGAEHALYNWDGKFYMKLRRFPGALIDDNGFVLFETEGDYLDCPGISAGIRVHFDPPISKLPGYISFEQWAKKLDAANRHIQDDSLQQSKEIEAYVRTGAGLGDAEANRKVERAAISYVIIWYKDRNWHVESVENQKLGYDLKCRKDTTVQCVEVKGIRGELPNFIITQREFLQAQRNPDFVLCAVTSAVSEQPRLFPFTGSQLLEKFEIAPLAYRASLR